MDPKLTTSNCALACMIMLLISINCAESEGTDDSAHEEKNNGLFALLTDKLSSILDKINGYTGNLTTAATGPSIFGDINDSHSESIPVRKDENTEISSTKSSLQTETKRADDNSGRSSGEIFEKANPCDSAVKTILCGPSTNCKSSEDKSSFTCKCKKGYRPVGSFYPTDNENTYIERCDDINECLKPTTCPKNASCINTPGSYECVCNDGFIKNPTGDRCIVCDCGGREISCAFKDGKKECVCPDGFAVVDGYCKKQRCVDRKCVNGQCNVVKDQEVCNCFEGFYLDGDTCVKKPCLKTPCINGTCVVRNNGYEQYICPSGYSLRSGSCIKNFLNLKEFV